MSIKQNKKMAPDIRFPLFEGEWKFPKAGSLFENSVSKGYEGLPIYSVTQANGMVERSSLDREFDDISDPKGNRFVKKDDIAYNMMRMWQGAVGVAPVDCMISPAYVVLAPNSDVSSQFYYAMFKSKKYLYLLTSYSQGLTSDRLRLYYKEFAQMNLPHPSLPEQQKIASFFSDIDTKIEKLSRKKELLVQYKKGIMQKIFSREIRFNDENGEDFPEWEEKTLGEISQNISYGMNSAAKEYDGKNKYIRITDIDEKSGRFIPNSVTSPKEELKVQYLLKQGDIVFARTGASVGKSYLYNKNDGRLFFAGFLIKFSIVNAIPSFISAYTFTGKYWKWVQIMSVRSGQPGINAEEYRSLKIMMPCLIEQKIIADFLSDLDSKIIRIDNEISAVKEFKKGLLQGMFV